MKQFQHDAHRSNGEMPECTDASVCTEQCGLRLNPQVSFSSRIKCFSVRAMMPIKEEVPAVFSARLSPATLSSAFLAPPTRMLVPRPPDAWRSGERRARHSPHEHKLLWVQHVRLPSRSWRECCTAVDEEFVPAPAWPPSSVSRAQ
jgi:hypothetical protein